MLMATENLQKPDGTVFGKVAVLLGGTSAEREISLETGNAVHAALCRKGVDAYTVDTKIQPLSFLLDEGFDRAFIALHGRGGEDGVIQGALQAVGIPYTGSGVLGSALALDKVRSKLIWQARDIPTPRFIEVESRSDLQQIAEVLGFPVMMKPVQEGSSCGAMRVTSQNDLERAWDKSKKFDNRVMAEQWIDGAEYTAGILQGRVLPFIRLETPREFYDYEAKYIEDTTSYICPCGLDISVEKRLGKLMFDAFSSLDASGWGRVDFIIDQNEQPWLIEVNTVPGMTSHSLVPMAAEQAGISFDDLVIKILETSLDHVRISEAVSL